jgi:hypothetical protein
MDIGLRPEQLEQLEHLGQLGPLRPLGQLGQSRTRNAVEKTNGIFDWDWKRIMGWQLWLELELGPATGTETGTSNWDWNWDRKLGLELGLKLEPASGTGNGTGTGAGTETGTSNWDWNWDRQLGLELGLEPSTLTVTRTVSGTKTLTGNEGSTGTLTLEYKRNPGSAGYSLLVQTTKDACQFVSPCVCVCTSHLSPPKLPGRISPNLAWR